MRLNKFIAQSTGMSRRAADVVIEDGRVTINGNEVSAGQQVTDTDKVLFDNSPLTSHHPQLTTIMLNKPPGYICSRDGQGGKTIYELLPPKLHHLKPVGRLDKNSSGLLLLTNDGDMAHKLTHPSFGKSKVYKIALNRPLSEDNFELITSNGVELDDGISKLELDSLNKNDKTNWKVTMSEGRNRQIRRTFKALDYNIVKLHRTQFGNYTLNELGIGKFEVAD